MEKRKCIKNYYCFQRGPMGPTGPTGLMGSTGPTGPTGSTSSLSNSMLCFSEYQKMHVIEQLLNVYSDNDFIVYTNSWFSVIGRPQFLYTSSEGNNPGLLVLEDSEGNIGAVSISSIMAIKPGTSSVYDPSITYLSPTFPLPEGCDTDVITAIHDYLPVSENNINIYMPILLEVSGIVIKNEYGMVVMQSSSDGAPVFISSSNIVLIENPSAS